MLDRTHKMATTVGDASSAKKRKRQRVSAKTMREMHEIAKSFSKDPEGYVAAPDSELLAELVDCVKDPLGIVQGLDLFRQLYGGLSLHDYAKDGATEGDPPAMPIDHPMFRIAACISVACKYASQQHPRVFAILRRQMRFRNDAEGEITAEMDVLKRSGFSPFKVLASGG